MKKIIVILIISLLSISGYAYIGKILYDELPSELRGFVDPHELVIDRLFAYNENDLLLAETVLEEADIVNSYGDIVKVPNFYRFVILTDKASTSEIEGASAGDTLYFLAKASDGSVYVLIPKNAVIHEPGKIKRVDMVLGTKTVSSKKFK